VAPILPGLSDKPELLADVVRAARDHGATHVWANLLYLRSGTREHFLEYLARDWPEVLPTYERLYASRAYLPDAQVKPLRDSVRRLAGQFEIADRRQTTSAALPTGGAPSRREPSRPEQLSLVLSDDARANHPHRRLTPYH
jgi:DNA repair photolyase